MCIFKNIACARENHSSDQNLSQYSYYTIRVLKIYKNTQINYENKIFGVAKTKQFNRNRKTSRLASDFSKEIFNGRRKNRE